MSRTVAIVVIQAVYSSYLSDSLEYIQTLQVVVQREFVIFSQFSFYELID